MYKTFVSMTILFNHVMCLDEKIQSVLNQIFHNENTTYLCPLDLISIAS